jgi:hypothetical protein
MYTALSKELAQTLMGSPEVFEQFSSCLYVLEY